MAETLSPPREQPFGNSLRGDVSTCRFDATHAAVELPEKNTRRIISHAFDAQKSHENALSTERQADKPHGQRWSAANEWKEQHRHRLSRQEQEEELKQVKQVEETLAGILRQLPEYQTSEANPLRPKTPAAGTATAPDSAEAETCTAADDGLPKPCKTVSFIIQRSHCLKNHLEIGSLAPAGQDADTVTAESEALVAAAAEQEKQQQLLDQLAEEIMKQYPHGVPKRLQHDLRARGVVLPTLGFGETHSAPEREAAFNQKR